VHFSVGPESYQERTAKIKSWLKSHYRGGGKFRNGGEKHEKDFTIYLGSYATMMAFVRFVEDDPIVLLLDPSNAGPTDRIVGATGKIGARFDPRGSETRRESWFYGYDGVPFTLEDQRASLARRKSRRELAEDRKTVLRQRFGDYFLPEGVV